jgi:hypothetical protein
MVSESAGKPRPSDCSTSHPIALCKQTFTLKLTAWSAPRRLAFPQAREPTGLNSSYRQLFVALCLAEVSLARPLKALAMPAPRSPVPESDGPRCL